jgi:hypothetical protein
MTRPDPSLPGDSGRNPLSEKVFDLLRGELPPDEAAALSARIEADPALRAERAGWERLFAAAAAAHALPADPDGGARTAARVLDRVRREESNAHREARTAPRGAVRWARILAASVAVHVVALGVLLVVNGSPLGRKASGPSGPANVTWRGGESGDGLAYDVPDRDLRDLPTFESPALPDATQRLAIEDQLEAPPPLAPTLPPSGEGASMSERLPRSSEWAPYHPSVARLMAIRVSDPEKRRILRLSGTDPDGTLRGVRVGLGYLASVVDPKDGGAFPAAHGRTRVWSTALGLLPFLGEGLSSRRGDSTALVDRSIGWLRRNASSARTTQDRGAALVALAEDYMLSNGLLASAERTQREDELRTLATALASAPAGTHDAADDLWRSMGLSAAARVGIAPGSAADRAAEGFVAQIRADVPAAVADPRVALVEGTAILWSRDVRASAPEGSAARAKFPEWNANVGPSLLGRIERDGGVTVPAGTSAGDRAEQTALVLVALQLAYRTY